MVAYGNSHVNNTDHIILTVIVTNMTQTLWPIHRPYNTDPIKGSINSSQDNSVVVQCTQELPTTLLWVTSYYLQVKGHVTTNSILTL